jgi:hypothetical protein
VYGYGGRRRSCLLQMNHRGRDWFTNASALTAASSHLRPTAEGAIEGGFEMGHVGKTE